MSFLKEIETLKAKYEKTHSEFYEINKEAYDRFINLILLCDNWHDKEAEITYQFDPEQYDGEFVIISTDFYLEEQYEKDVVGILSGAGGADYMSFSAADDGRLCLKIGVKNVWLKVI